MSKAAPITFAFSLPEKRNVDTLINDQTSCAQLLKDDWDNQCLRRVYCRTNLAMVEGCVCYFKSAAHRFAGGMRAFSNVVNVSGPRLNGKIFNDVVLAEESELLLDRVFTVGKSGKVKPTTRFLDFKTNFKFTFQMVDRVFKTTCSPDYESVSEWGELQLAVGTRNRITHPKHDASLDVTDPELETVASGCQWFLDFGGSVFEQIAASVDRDAKELADLEEKVLSLALTNMSEALNAIDTLQKDQEL